MTAIERSAYPRLRQSHFRQYDLQLYLPSREEITWTQEQLGDDLQLKVGFLVRLKTFQRLGYFMKVNTVTITSNPTCLSPLGKNRTPIAAPVKCWQNTARWRA